jgi:hypothetical protein
MSERALQHEYSPLSRAWAARPVLIRMEHAPFGRGASRQAYRLKLLPAADANADAGYDSADANGTTDGATNGAYSGASGRRGGGARDGAQEYVAKSGITGDGSLTGSGAEAFDGARLQHEVAYWAHAFNGLTNAATAAAAADDDSADSASDSDTTTATITTTATTETATTTATITTPATTVAPGTTATTTTTATITTATTVTADAATASASLPLRLSIVQCAVLELTARPRAPVVSCEEYMSVPVSVPVPCDEPAALVLAGGQEKEQEQGRQGQSKGQGQGPAAEWVIYGSDTLGSPPACSEPAALAFFLFSFYASGGLTMPVHMEGAGGAFTNPQVHSYDCHYGQADFGRRGMALFLVGDHWNALCLSLGLPRFALSMRELERAERARARALRLSKRRPASGLKQRASAYAVSRSDALCLQKKLASNSSIRGLTRGHSNEDLFAPGAAPRRRQLAVDTFEAAVDAAAHIADAAATMIDTCEACLDMDAPPPPPAADPLSADEAAEVLAALAAAGEYAARVTRAARSAGRGGSYLAAVTGPVTGLSDFFRIEEDALFAGLCPGVLLCPQSPSFSPEGPLYDQLVNCSRPERLCRLQRNIGEVHLELALLEAYGRFSSGSAVRFGSSAQCAGTGGQPDAASSFFHLSQACRHGSCAAALALGRLSLGLETAVSPLLTHYLTPDRGAALGLLLLAAHRGSLGALLMAGDVCAEEGRLENAIVLCRIALQIVTAPAPPADGSEGVSLCGEALSAGDQAEVDWGGAWYPAEVVSVCAEGPPSAAYLVRFLDGDEEMAVGAAEVRALPGSQDGYDEWDGGDGGSAPGGQGQGEDDYDEVSSGGLITPLCRASIGDDAPLAPPEHELLSRIGGLYARLHAGKEGGGRGGLQFIDPAPAEEAAEDEDIYDIYTLLSPERDENINLYSEYCTYPYPAGGGSYLLATACKFYNAASEAAVEAGLPRAARAHIAAAQSLERLL